MKWWEIANLYEDKSKAVVTLNVYNALLIL